MRKISLSIAMSLDGYIAKPNDGLTFLKLVEKVGGENGYGENGTRLKTADWSKHLTLQQQKRLTQDWHNYIKNEKINKEPLIKVLQNGGFKTKLKI